MASDSREIPLCHLRSRPVGLEFLELLAEDGRPLRLFVSAPQDADGRRVHKSLLKGATAFGAGLQFHLLFIPPANGPGQAERVARQPEPVG